MVKPGGVLLLPTNAPLNGKSCYPWSFWGPKDGILINPMAPVPGQFASSFENIRGAGAGAECKKVVDFLGDKLPVAPWAAPRTKKSVVLAYACFVFVWLIVCCVFVCLVVCLFFFGGLSLFWFISKFGLCCEFVFLMCRLVVCLCC